MPKVTIEKNNITKEESDNNLKRVKEVLLRILNNISNEK